MKISGLRAYRIELPLHEGSYKWSGGNAVTVFDSTVVAVDTDAGITGWGEVCPLGPAYLPAYAAGARTGIAELAPQLLGADPLALGTLNERMDGAMRGHPYVKSAIDMACWDILGKASGLSVATLMGGHVGDDFALYRAISQESPEQMAARIAAYRKEGYTKFQLKVGGDPNTDIDRIRATSAVLERGDVLIADANTGWTQHAAVRVADAVRDVDVYIEQPCPTYDQCLAVRRHTNRPFVLDEVIDGIDMVVRGVRDLCVSLGIAMTIEDTWGGDITTAAISHLAHSTPTRYLFSATDFNSYVTVSFADGAPRRAQGRLAASREPGLGVKPRLDLLGQPVIKIG